MKTSDFDVEYFRNKINTIAEIQNISQTTIETLWNEIYENLPKIVKNKDIKALEQVCFILQNGEIDVYTMEDCITRSNGTTPVERNNAIYYNGIRMLADFLRIKGFYRIKGKRDILYYHNKNQVSNYDIHQFVYEYTNITFFESEIALAMSAIPIWEGE